MKEIKTVADVQAVPAGEFIMMYNPAEEGTCPFCGRKLTYEIVGFGRNKCRQYHDCGCLVARAAKNHNELQKIMSEEARENKQYEEFEARAKRRQEEAQKPVTITAAELFSVISGRSVPRIEPIQAYDRVAHAMHKIGFEGTAEKMLAEYAQLNNWGDDLKTAADELFALLPAHSSWDTDISKEVSFVCDAHNIPKSITI